MVDPELGLTLVFNGCIYNHKELRAELEGKGYRSSPRADTEVVLKSWHAWGPEASVRFNGMFAFVVHERETGRVALARDRLGIKPLYYTQNKTRLRFALDAARARRRGRRRYGARSRRPCPLHDIPRHRAAAAYDPARRP